MEEQLICTKCWPKHLYLIARYSYEQDGVKFKYCLLSHQRGHMFRAVRDDDDWMYKPQLVVSA